MLADAKLNDMVATLLDALPSADIWIDTDTYVGALDMSGLNVWVNDRGEKRYMALNRNTGEAWCNDQVLGLPFEIERRDGDWYVYDLEVL